MEDSCGQCVFFLPHQDINNLATSVGLVDMVVVLYLISTALRAALNLLCHIVNSDEDPCQITAPHFLSQGLCHLT